jgi:hypothetical protein
MGHLQDTHPLDAGPRQEGVTFPPVLQVEREPRLVPVGDGALELGPLQVETETATPLFRASATFGG